MNVVSWVRSRFYWWRHRNDTPEQKTENIRKARADLYQAYQNVKESFSDEPESREMMSLFIEMDRVFEEMNVRQG